MAVQITVDFTDEQWELIKEYMLCYLLKYDENGEILGNEGLLPTEELMAQRFKQEVQETVNKSHKIKTFKTLGTDTEAIFIL